MKIHPASLLDYEEIADTFAQTITHQIPHWDADMVKMHPEMTKDCSHEADEVLSSCVDRGLASDYLESDDPKAHDLIAQWSKIRMNEVKERMEAINIEDGFIAAHRMIAAHPDDLKNPLGIFWSHDFDNWPDPVTPWGANIHDIPTLVIEAKIPMEAVNWRFSALCLMSWLLGDTESELRTFPGYPIKDVKVSILGNGKEVEIPTQKWTT